MCVYIFSIAVPLGRVSFQCSVSNQFACKLNEWGLRFVYVCHPVCCCTTIFKPWLHKSASAVERYEQQLKGKTRSSHTSLILHISIYLSHFSAAFSISQRSPFACIQRTRVNMSMCRKVQFVKKKIYTHIPTCIFMSATSF